MRCRPKPKYIATACIDIWGLPPDNGGEPLSIVNSQADGVGLGGRHDQGCDGSAPQWRARRTTRRAVAVGAGAAAAGTTAHYSSRCVQTVDAYGRVYTKC
jgi:hypothetical protein